MRRSYLLAALAVFSVACTATGLVACAPDDPVSPTVCLEHEDENGDGKCDICGEDIITSTPESVLYQTGVVSFRGGVGNAYITFEDEIFCVNVNIGDGYSVWLSGTWEMEGNTLTLTAEWQEGEDSTSLTDAVSGQPKTYSLTDMTYNISVNLPGAGVVTFVLDMDEQSVTYTVRYMLNAGKADELYITEGFSGTQEIKGRPEEAYIAAAPADPVRDGYFFAGWQTKPNIESEDIVNGVSKYLWMFGQKLSYTGVTKYANMSAEEIAARDISDEVMLLDSADVNGVVTLYARWVQETEIFDADGLKNISKDLYGAYKLTKDIDLNAVWEPIGAYFSNYEYYNTEWWTYAFRGTLNGNGKRISGLSITTAQINKDYDAEGSVWHDDGVNCDGTSAMFGALAGANICSLKLENPSISITYSGDYLYSGVLAAFDMDSTLTEIKVIDCNIDVTFDDKLLSFRNNPFVAIGGLDAGGWNNIVTNCELTGKIVLNVTGKASRGGEIYLGGLLGENYSTTTDCKVDTVISLRYTDECTGVPDNELIANVGGLSGSGTSIKGNIVKTNMTVAVVKPNGESSINVGGIVGSQRYLTTEQNTVEGSIMTSDCSLDEKNGVLNVGGVGGRLDVYYTLQILAYSTIANAGAQNNVQDVTVNGIVTDAVIADCVGKIAGCWYIAKGDQLDGAILSNIEEIVGYYGSYLPVDSLMDGIIYVVNSAAEEAA